MLTYDVVPKITRAGSRPARALHRRSTNMIRAMHVSDVRFFRCNARRAPRLKLI